MTRTLELRVLAHRFAVARLDPDSEVPDWAVGEVTCIARTPTELSIVCDQAQLPDSVRANGPWRCLEVAGPLAFTEIGILSSLTATLRTARVSVFVFSTFDTDYLMVREDKLARATKSLEEAGHSVRI